MNKVTITIDGQKVFADSSQTILQAARSAGVYLPSLCNHPSLPPVESVPAAPCIFRGPQQIENDRPHARWDGCGICTVEVSGKLERACRMTVTQDMQVKTDSERIRKLRREYLSEILAGHPHACIFCAQADGCPRTQCSMNIAENERCCTRHGSCEIQRLARYIGMPMGLAYYPPKGLQRFEDDPLFEYHPDLCIGCLRCVRACTDLQGVGAWGFVIQSGRVIVGYTLGSTRGESGCRYDGACIEVCPTGALRDKIFSLRTKPIRVQELVPCRENCPIQIDIPRMLRHIQAHDLYGAYCVMREKTPLAHTISYVCSHPCERACRRCELGGSISICRLKRYVVEKHDPDRYPTQVAKASTGKTISIVGSGPSGLSAAHYLASKGHKTCIYEALPEPGGMLRVGIPAFRLPRNVLNQDIETVRHLGVEIFCNHPIGPKELTKLRDESNAVLIATGAHGSQHFDLPACHMSGVYQGIDVLRDLSLGRCNRHTFQGATVRVLGGGNMAVDTARTIVRLGARDVSVISPESEAHMPAWKWDITQAKQEGISFIHQWAPSQIIGSDQPNAVRCKRCVQTYDEQGNFKPRYDETSQREFEADVIVLAMGQTPSSSPFKSLGLTHQGAIACDAVTMQTNDPKVYACADVVSGPKSVVEALAMGNKAARQIDLALGGDGHAIEAKTAADHAPKKPGKNHGFAKLARNHPAKLDAFKRIHSFDVVEKTFDPEAALAEAERCLHCDLRLSIEQVKLPPEKKEEIFEFNQNTVSRIPQAEGVFRLFNANRQIIAIKGVADLRCGLLETLTEGGQAAFFSYLLDPMYTQRESELIQLYLQEHGKLPAGADSDLDDLY